ncbi:histidine-rich glycoprotein-like [Contarinia nasturtii]|uniref:histidine-rich glycoprotein-like n=1 Tax=Contarinia nasturtii TaxID=265458 RepID=UPI0012D3B0DF|nr:histidine-rich glycoprotein-like [Contarinia nasturtii]
MATNILQIFAALAVIFASVNCLPYGSYGSGSTQVEQVHQSPHEPIKTHYAPTKHESILPHQPSSGYGHVEPIKNHYGQPSVHHTPIVPQHPPAHESPIHYPVEHQHSHRGYENEIKQNHHHHQEPVHGHVESHNPHHNIGHEGHHQSSYGHNSGLTHKSTQGGGLGGGYGGHSAGHNTGHGSVKTHGY